MVTPKKTSSDQDIVQHRQYLCLPTPTEGGGVTGAKYA
jgi:hypothetical protein